MIKTQTSTAPIFLVILTYVSTKNLAFITNEALHTLLLPEVNTYHII
jgi:hypothetical protein